MTDQAPRGTVGILVTLKGSQTLQAEGLSEPVMKELVMDIRKKRGSPDELVRFPGRVSPEGAVEYFFASEVTTIKVWNHPRDLDLRETIVGL